MASTLRHFRVIASAVVSTAASSVTAVVTVAAPLAAAFIAVTVAIDLPHHSRWARFQFIDPHRQCAQYVFVDVLLALDLADRRGWRVDIKQGEMGLAVLADAIGQGLDAPVFRLRDAAAHLLDDTPVTVRQFVHLLLRQILSS